MRRVLSQTGTKVMGIVPPHSLVLVCKRHEFVKSYLLFLWDLCEMQSKTEFEKRVVVYQRQELPNLVQFSEYC